MKKVMILLIMSIIVLFGCSSKEENTIDPNGEQLNIYGWAPTVDTTDIAYFEQWASNLLGVEVVVTTPSQENNAYLTSSISAGNNFDLIYIDQSEYYSLVEQGALMDVTQEIDNTIVSGQTYLDSITIENQIYAFPIYAPSYEVPMVREDWLAEFNMEVPSSLDEWELYFKNCKEQKGAYGLTLNTLDDIQPFMDIYGLKPGITYENGVYSIDYASEESIIVWQWLEDMYKKQYINPNFETITQVQVNEDFVNGTTGCTIQNINAIEQIESFGIDVTYAQSKNSYYESMELLAIPTNANNPELAVQFMELWYSESGKEVLNNGYENYTYVIENNEIVYTEAYNSFKNIYSSKTHPLETVDNINVSNVMIEGNWSDIKNIIYSYGSNIIKNHIDPNTGISSMQNEINSNSHNLYNYEW